MYDRIIAYDLETTGFVVGRHKILELGAVIYYPEEDRKETYSSLVDVKGPISWKISLITGIDRSVIRKEGCKSLESVLADFISFADGALNPLYVGHNALSFDNVFINNGLRSIKQKPIKDTSTWDTMLQIKADKAHREGSNFRYTQKKAKEYTVNGKINLSAACTYYGVPGPTRKHRALPDAVAAFDIFQQQAKRSKWRIYEKQ